MKYEIIGAIANLRETAVSGLIDVLISEQTDLGFQEEAEKALRRINTDAKQVAVKRWEYEH